MHFEIEEVQSGLKRANIIPDHEDGIFVIQREARYNNALKNRAVKRLGLAGVTPVQIQAIEEESLEVSSLLATDPDTGTTRIDTIATSPQELALYALLNPASGFYDQEWRLILSFKEFEPSW